ncbi:DUF2304 domain-containing protein [Conyzicola sp.]|uniref:DUF2304 domain-containing protein n=1 Tax=Conyzicola sp. TaxID=1969404 RepID=UPI0039892A15
MTTTAYIFGIVSSGLVVIAVFELLRRRQVRERHAVWWVIASLFALLVSIFPSLLDWVAKAVGVAAPINLGFFVTIVILFLLSVQHGAEFTNLEEKTRALAEQSAFLRQRVEALEGRLDITAAQPENEQGGKPDAGADAEPPDAGVHSDARPERQNHDEPHHKTH